MEAEIIEIIKTSSHPNFDLGRGIDVYESYTNKTRTARQISFDTGLALTNVYALIHRMQTKVARAEKQLKKQQTREVKSIEQN